MPDNNGQKFEIPAEKIIDLLMHTKQVEQHYATQESVDNLKERMNEKFSDVDKRFSDVDKRFDRLDKRLDKLSAKSDRLLWFIVAMFIASFFKEQFLQLFN